MDKAQKDCFDLQMQSLLLKCLSSYKFSKNQSITELIHLTLTVTSEGSLIIENTEEIQALKGLKEHLQQRFDTLSKFSPAFKRGIPVTSQYTVPLEFKIELQE